MGGAMIAEAPGPLDFQMLLQLFGEKMSGTDPEETIMAGWHLFDPSASGEMNVDAVKALRWQIQLRQVHPYHEAWLRRVSVPYVSPSNSKGHDIVLSSRGASRLKVLYRRYTQHRVLNFLRSASQRLSIRTSFSCPGKENYDIRRKTPSETKKNCLQHKETNEQTILDHLENRKKTIPSLRFLRLLSEKGRGEGG